MSSFLTWISAPLTARSLRAKLALAFGLALLLTAMLMGVSLWGARQAEKAIIQLHDVDFRVEQSILRIRIQLLEARRYEKEFLLRWRELGFGEARNRYVNLLRANLAEIPLELTAINRQWADVPGVGKLTGEIERAAAEYQRDFIAVADVHGRLGFVDSGLEADLRAKAHTIEALIPARAPALRAELLEMRRREKDYLLRSRGQDAAALYRAATHFEESLTRTPLAVPLRAQLTLLTQTYRDKFAQYVFLHDESDRLRRAYLIAATRVEPPLQQLQAQATGRLTHTRAQALNTAHWNSAAVFAAGGSAILFGLLTALMLSHNVTRSVDALLTFAEKIAGGDLSARISRNDDGEFGRLALALERMVTALQQSQGELRRSNVELEQRIAQRTLQIRAANRGLTERTREMALLAHLSQAMLRSTGCGEAKRMIAHFLAQLFPQGAGRLYIRHGATDTFDSHAEWNTPRLTAPTLTASSCVLLRLGISPCTCCDHPGIACLYPPEASPDSAALCVSLVSPDETFGLIYLELPTIAGGVGGSKRIDPSDKMLLTRIGDHVALGLTTLRLREALLEQATRDALTGLYNRRYLEETLAREIKRARRQQGKLAAIMLDVDFFKRFNDNYGHEAGDVVLAAIGRLLEKNIRASDVACRYGGEEFTILLPDTDVAQAAERAELIRRAAHKMVLAHDIALSDVTLSLGVAEFPLHGETGATLLAAADAALFRAKHGGRDRVEIAG